MAATAVAVAACLSKEAGQALKAQIKALESDQLD